MPPLSIKKDVAVLESQISQYIKSVQQYAPTYHNLTEIVEKDVQIENLKKLSVNDMNFDLALGDLKNESDSLNEKLWTVLNTLQDARQKLLDLPDEYEEFPSDFTDNPLLSLELLAYASKLAKFTTIPATTDLNIGPANYIWPGEDNLRRGVMAMAVKYRDVLIGEEKEEVPEQEVKEEKEQEVVERRPSFEYGDRPPKVEPSVGLDLLDSDEESD